MEQRAPLLVCVCVRRIVCQTPDRGWVSGFVRKTAHMAKYLDRIETATGHLK